MPTYQLADSDVHSVINDAIHKYHGGLEDVGLLVKCLMARPTENEDGDPTGPAVTHDGYPCAAKIKILSLKDRVSTGCDVELTIDQDEWEVLSEEQRLALVDHELTHLELCVDDDGGVKRDDADRPKLRGRKHDRQLGWFDVVAHRHGEASAEVRQCREFLASEAYHQCYLFETEEATV